MYKDTLKSYITPSRANLYIYDQIFGAQAQEFQTIEEKITDIKNQFDINKATWALDYYEQMLGIVTDYTKSYDYRRIVIKTKLQGTNKLTLALLKLIAETYNEGEVETWYDGIIHFEFIAHNNIPRNFFDMQKAIEEVKPAYILANYIFQHLTWDMLDAKNLNFDNLDNAKIKWDVFETGLF